MSEESLVALMIGRPLQLAFPERRAPGTSRRCSWPSRASRRAVRPDRPGGREGRDRRNRRRRGQRAGAVPARRWPASSARPAARLRRRRLDSRSPLGPLRAGVVLLSGDRAGESLFPVLSVRANATIQVLRAPRTPRLHQPPARAATRSPSSCAVCASAWRRSSSRCSPCPAATSRRSR